MFVYMAQFFISSNLTNQILDGEEKCHVLWSVDVRVPLNCSVAGLTVDKIKKK